MEMCEQCFYQLYMVGDLFRLSSRSFQRLKQSVKAHYCLGSAMAQQPRDHSNGRRSSIKGARHANIIRARLYFAKHKYPMTELDLMLSCIPEDDASMEALDWMITFFTTTADKSPIGDNRVELNGLYSYDSIYGLFCKQTVNVLETHPVVSGSTFRDIWKRCFPNVRIKKSLSVNGKCEVCALIFDREEFFRRREEVDYLKFLKYIHRHTVMRCREHYRDNRRLALLHPEIYMSIIIDGMQQSHCNLPHRANNKVYDKEVIQHIQGVRHHGLWDNFYRTFPNIGGGGNLAIEVLLREILLHMEHCRTNNMHFPRILFLQVDGGSENACVSFYAMAQVLVKLGVFDVIELNRLPVGHTHEDIDALFGKIWEFVKGSTIKTPQEWAAKVVASFNLGRM